MSIFYIALFVHLISLIVGFGAVIVIDVFGFLLMLRKIELPFMNRMAGITQRLIWIGWIGLVLSGIVLIMQKGYVSNLASIKIFFVAMLGVNGINLHFIKRATAPYFTYSEIPTIYKFRMFFATAISQLGWWGAIVIGFVNRHIGVARDWPANPSIYIIGIAAAILIMWVVGELLLKSKEI